MSAAPRRDWGPDARSARLPEHRRAALARGEAPVDYAELLTAYHGMVLKVAQSMGIPSADREDAAAEVELRFWRKGGLEWFDPERLHEPPAAGWRDGAPAAPRRARFGGMYRRWVWLSMHSERDRHANRLRRQVLTDEMVEPAPAESAEESVVATWEVAASARGAADWVHDANACLPADWARVLALVCEVAPRRVRRGELAAALGRRVRTVGTELDELRARLDAAGLGADTLRT